MAVRMRFFNPTTAGMTVSRNALVAAFDELLVGLQRELALTVVMITHDLDSIFRTCNRVGVIIDRRMVAAPLAEIVEHPHPWIQAYFHGTRGRAAAQAANAAGSD